MSFDTTHSNGGPLVLGRGKVYIDRLSAAGALQGAFLAYNVTNASIATEDDTIDKRTSMDSTNGLLAQDTRGRDVTLKLTFDGYTKEMLAVALMGETGEYTQTNTPVVDEAIESARVKVGGYFKVAKRSISSITLSKASAPGTPLTLNTDYQIADAEAGLFYIPSGSSILDGEALLVDYTPATISAGSGRKTIAGGTKSRVEARILFIPDNVRGANREAEFWKVSISPDGEVPLITEEYGEVSINCAVLNDAANHPTEPYYRLLERP